jgi:Ser/Thr protein kinase RdoA (MazF antagonist)
MAYYEARNGGGEAEREADLAEQLEAFRGAIQRARSEIEGRLLEVILYTDFNRYNVLWGGPQVWTDTGRRNEG